MQKMLLRILSLVLLVSFMVSPVVAQSPDRDPRAEGLGEPEQMEVEKINHLQRVTGYIVLLEGDSLATYQGGISGLPATSPSVTDQEIDIQRPEIVRYLDYLEAQQDMVIAEVESVLAREIDVKFRYDVILNGFAAEMSLGEAQTLEGLDGIRAVLPDEIWQPDTDVSPGFLGADTIWADSPSTPGALATKGEGMVIGVLDTGINLDHPSFADIGDDGYDHTNPYDPPVYKGLCATDPTNFVCNDKRTSVAKLICVFK